jgi:hypothetical protein
MKKHDASLSSLHPPSSLLEPMLPCPKSSDSCYTLPLCCLHHCRLPPLPTMAGCCVLGGWGWTSSSSLPLKLSSLSSLSPCPPHQECRAGTCKGGRGLVGNHISVNTAPSPFCGRAGKASKRMFSWLSSSTNSLKTVFFHKNCQSYKRNSSVHL